MAAGQGDLTFDMSDSRLSFSPGWNLTNGKDPCSSSQTVAQSPVDGENFLLSLDAQSGALTREIALSRDT